MVLPFFIELSPLTLTCLIIFNAVMIGMNFQCIAHNFVHHPFFKSSFLNNLFSIMNTLVIGVLQSMYKIHHINHHRYNNQPKLDGSSTYTFGKDGKEENIFSYIFLGLVRMNFADLYSKASKNSRLPFYELVVSLLFLGILLILNWKLVLLYIIPSYIAGQTFSLWQNYCEHHRANPYDRKRDSVSCYNEMYNFLWFNNGYHQEHHYSPQVHWSEIKKVRNQLPKDRIIVKGLHLTNSF
jgi:fatty acid desaturase